MKKLAMAVSLLFLISGCKEKQHSFTPEEVEAGKKKMEKLFVNSYENRSCDNLIAVNMDLVDKPDVWANENSEFKPTGNVENRTLCGTSQNYIDVFIFIKKKNDLKKEHLAKWLQAHGNEICFKDTYDYIECAHKFSDDAIKEYLSLRPTVAHITFKKINSILLAVTPQVKYETDNYKHYIKLELDDTMKVIPTLEDSYKEDGGYYSLPFLRRLLEKYGEDTDGNGVNDDMIFDFIKGDLFAPDKLFFKIIDPNGEAHYFDFSQIPTGISTVPLKYLFSPM